MMHSRVYKEFERIISQRGVSGSVLEVGAIPSEESLLRMAPLKDAAEKTGINLAGPHEWKGIKILKCNANHMECFEDDKFGLVMCNAMIEHDKYFWKTIAEIKRVTKPGGLIVIGAPGFTYLRAEKLKSTLRKIPVVWRLEAVEYLNFVFRATVTFEVHNNPGDYYRFSPQAFKEVLFDGMVDVEIRTIMLPPRIIGCGRKPP